MVMIVVEKITDFIPEFVVTMPDKKDMKDGILYISDEYELAIHRCFCGCGGQSVTPTGDNRKLHEWSIKNVDGKVSLNPSILNRFCGSHYYIRGNRVEWL